MLFTSFIVSYAVIGSISISTIAFALASYAYFFSVTPIFQESGDEYEDKIFNIKSLSRKLTWKNKIILMCCGMFAYSGIFLLAYNQMGYNIIFPVTICLLTLIFLPPEVIPLLGEYNTKKIRTSRNIAYGYFLLTYVIYIIGAVKLPFF